MSISILFGLISSTSILIPAISGAINRKNLNKKATWFFYFILFTVPFEGIFIVTALNGINNIPFINCFLLYEFIFLSILLLHWLLPNLDKRWYVLPVLAISTWWGFNILQQGAKTIDLIFVLVEDLSLIALSGIFLIQFIHTIDKKSWQKGLFWIASGIFIYFTSTTLIELVNPYAESNKDSLLSIYYSYIHSSINIICNTLFTIGFLCRK